MVTPKFLHGQGNFHIALKQRVNQYFSDIKKPSTGNTSLLLKGILFFACYLFLYIHLVFLHRPGGWLCPNAFCLGVLPPLSALMLCMMGLMAALANIKL